MALFPDDRDELPILACETVRVQLDKIELRRSREWGACWLGLCVGCAGTGHVSETAVAVKPQGDKLGEHAESVELLPADRSGEQISFSP